MNFGSGKYYTWELYMQDNFNVILMGVLAGLQIPNILHGKLLYVGTSYLAKNMVLR